MLPASPALARVARGDLCAGCGACAALAPNKIGMQLAEAGYLRPEQTEPLSDSEEVAIAEVCPGLGQTVRAAGRQDSLLWGPYVSMQTGWATDPAIRYAGSSGGALSMILIHLITTGVVDAVVQTAASADLSIGNTTVVTATTAEIKAAAGSRYAPSAPLSDLPVQIASGKRLAFVGKPCDAAALLAMRDRDPKVAAAFPIILSFFCAGIPSHAGGKAVLAALGTDLDKTASFRFRGNGWPGQASATQHDRTVLSMSYHDSWGKILSKHLQHRCKICADGTGMAADIVCADAWESDAAGYPVFEEAPGISLIVARTALGAELVASAQTAGQIEIGPFDVSTLAAVQPGQRERRRALAARIAGLRLLARPAPRYKGLQLVAVARQNSLRRNLSNFLGMVRRAAGLLRPS